MPTKGFRGSSVKLEKCWVYLVSVTIEKRMNLCTYWMANKNDDVTIFPVLKNNFSYFCSYGIKLESNTRTVIGIFPGKSAGQSELFYIVSTPAEERDQTPDQTVDVDGRDQIDFC